MLKAVLFDFGGVLTESGKSGFIRQTIAELYGRDPKDIDIGDMHYVLRRGTGNEDLFFDTLNEQYGGHVTKEMFVEKTQSSFAPSAEVYELAKQLRKHGLRTGILSNVFAMNAQALRNAGWYDDFDPVILSCETGYAKPDVQFYELALAKLNLPADEVLFIDDQQKCMPPATKLGIHTLIAKSPDQIVADTKALVYQLNGIAL